MDADLYDQLNTTVTRPAEQDSQSDGNTEASQQQAVDGKDIPESEGSTTTRRQRTTSASLPQELDQVVHAITASPWAARLGSLVGNVRKQGESVFETTKERATKELDHVRSGIAAFATPIMSPSADEASQADKSDLAHVDSSRNAEPMSPTRLTAGSMFSYLRSTADAAQKKISPTLKELSKAEDAADAYLNKLGASFGQLLKDVVTIAPPEEEADQKDGDVLFDNATEKKKQIYTSRTDAMLHDLHSNQERLLCDPDIKAEASYGEWEKSFSVEQRTDEIASLLERYPELRSLMDSLVPETVSYSDFWRRYLFQKSKIDTEEAKRKKVFENSHEDNDFDWDGEDEEDDGRGSESGLDGKNSTETVKAAKATTSQQEENPRNSSTSESSTSFDVVSVSSALPPTAKEKVTPLAEESDDDWE